MTHSPAVKRDIGGEFSHDSTFSLVRFNLVKKNKNFISLRTVENSIKFTIERKKETRTSNISYGGYIQQYRLLASFKFFFFDFCPSDLQKVILISSIIHKYFDIEKE